MFSLLIALLMSPLAEAKPVPNQRFPKQFVALLQKGGWTPTPTNSGRYQIGDVFDFSANKKILAGSKCLDELPDAQPMANINIINMLKGGLTIPFGVFKGKAKGKRYKKSTFANTVVSELDEMDLSSGYKEKCRRFLRQRNNGKLQLIKAIIQSQVTEQECSGKEVEFGFRKVGVGAETYERCDQDAQALVTIAYQLVPLSTVLANSPATTAPLVPIAPAKPSKVNIQGGGEQDFAALARQAQQQEAAEKAEEERIRKAKEAIAAAEKAKQERKRQLKIALEKAAQKQLGEAEQTLQAKATRDWNAIKGMLKGGGKSVQSVVKKYIKSYEGVKLEIKGFSRVASIPEVALAKKWLGEQGSGPVSKGDGYEAVLIPAGTFTMGCTPEQGSDCYGSEKPSHSVRISRSFYMMKSEVTQGLYKKVMGKNPSSFSSCGSNCPVEQVSWYDAVTFANKLSKKEGRTPCYSISGTNVRFKGLSCTGWRLPTEAEWEFAARGGQSTKYAGSSDVDSVAWYDKNSGSKTHAVCGKRKNKYGLCDMSGNVWEWVWDWYDDYSSSSQTDPAGPTSGSYRVHRGGFWNDYARNARVSSRYGNAPSRRDFNLGFRLSRSASAQ